MKFIRKLMDKFQQDPDVLSRPDEKSSYFVRAKSWADDIYTETIASRNRYRAALIWSVCLMSCLIATILILLPLEHTELVMVHHTDSGTVWIEPLHTSYMPNNKSEVESDIVRYVINRESYSSTSYDERYSLVNVLSSPSVAKQYMNTQSLSNKDSDVNRFGSKGTRKVHVQNVVFLDNPSFKGSKHKHKKHHNLAQVNFLITSRNNLTGKITRRPLLALISWVYRGTPTDPDSKWRNWNGFTITRYSVEQRNV